MAKFRRDRIGVPGPAGKDGPTEAQVATMVTEKLAADPTVASAAATAATSAVATEVATRELVQVGDQIVRGKNLYDVTAAMAGYILGTTGVPTVSGAYTTSDFIRVTGGQAYTASGSTNNGPRMIAFYDTSKTFISRIDNGATPLVWTGTAPANGYMRVSFLNVTTIPQVEAGSVRTAYEAYRLSIPRARLSAQNLLINAVESDAVRNASITPDKTSFFRPGKNLFDPAEITAGVYLAETNGTAITAASYITSGYIPVTAGQPYTVTQARKIILFDGAKVFVSGGNYNQATVGITVTPAVDGFLRVSLDTNHASYTPEKRQVEAGSSVTAYAPFARTIPVLAFTPEQVAAVTGAAPLPAPLTLTVAGALHTINTDLAGAALAIVTSKSGSANGTFNFQGTTLDGVTIHATTDDITPIRTFATVGANHGYGCIVAYTVSGHGKTAADLGSTWTDGTRTYTLLLINGNELTFGGAYTVDGAGVVTGDSTDPAATLTHVSGATNTTSVPITAPIDGRQLYPSVKAISVRYEVDGAPVTANGTYRATVVRVIESYEIIDYKSLIDWARSHVGQSFAANTAAIDGVVRIANVYTFRGGGRCTVSSSLTALKPVALGNTGFLQSVALGRAGHTTHRYMPGVKPKSGVDFSQFVDMTGYSANLVFGPADSIDISRPPSRYVDWLVNGSGQRVVGFTMGYISDKTNSKDSDRAQLAMSWDMRSTKKSYPNAIGGAMLNPGDSRGIEGFRNYLAPHPSGATNVNVVEDAQAAYVHLDFHGPGVAVPIPLPEQIGRSVAVLTTTGLTVANDTVDANGLTVTVPGTAGRAVVKLT